MLARWVRSDVELQGPRSRTSQTAFPTTFLADLRPQQKDALSSLNLGKGRIVPPSGANSGSRTLALARAAKAKKREQRLKLERIQRRSTFARGRVAPERGLNGAFAMLPESGLVWTVLRAIWAIRNALFELRRRQSGGQEVLRRLRRGDGESLCPVRRKQSYRQAILR